ncbi:MAG TPA: hypothetical protein VFR49_07220 [Solirubrobacteraceae bacterium]|nr:hypothetical protein [Solirubrobacteraceae bacterium]
MEAATPQSTAVGDEAEPAPLHEELAALRTQVLALEAELAETHRRANEAIAAAQERVYWLDRWHIDLNELMLRRWAINARAILRGGRGLLRRLRRFSRALR